MLNAASHAFECDRAHRDDCASACACVRVCCVRGARLRAAHSGQPGEFRQLEIIVWWLSLHGSQPTAVVGTWNYAHNNGKPTQNSCRRRD